MVCIFVFWICLCMLLGVMVDLVLFVIGGLGELGIDGYVDNCWLEWIVVVMLFLLIDDVVKFSI